MGVALSTMFQVSFPVSEEKDVEVILVQFFMSDVQQTLYPFQSEKVEEPASSIVKLRVEEGPVGRFPALKQNHCRKVPSPSRHFSGLSDREKDALEGSSEDQVMLLVTMAPPSLGSVMVGGDADSSMLSKFLFMSCRGCGREEGYWMLAWAENYSR